MVLIIGKKQVCTVSQIMRSWASGLAALALVAGLSSGVVLLAAPAAMANTLPPGWTNSEYMSSISTTGSYTDGCNFGKGGAGGVHVLDYGRPAYNSTTDQFGAILFNGGWASNSQIFASAEAWADGWYSCSPAGPVLSIAVGVNNYCGLGTNNSICTGYLLPATHGLYGGGSGSGPDAAGSYFAAWTNNFETYIQNSGYSTQESAAAAIDAEPAYDPDPGWAAHTNAFVSYYNADTSHYMYDFGSAEPGYVTDQELYDVSYGLRDQYNLPEIYSTNQSGMTQDWLGVDQYANPNWIFTGVTDNYNASSCTITPNSDANYVLNATQNDPYVPSQTSIRWITNYEC